MHCDGHNREAARRGVAALLDDRRGASTYVQSLVLLVILGLGGVAAVKALSASFGATAACAGLAVEKLAVAAPCAEGGPGPGDPVSAVAALRVASPPEAPRVGPSGQRTAGGPSRSGGAGEQYLPMAMRFGGAPQSADEAASDRQKEGGKPDVTVGVEDRPFISVGGEGAASQPFDDSRGKTSYGYYKYGATGYGQANSDGLVGGMKLGGKVSVANAQGKYGPGKNELPLGIEGSDEGDVVSAEGSVDARAGISKDVVGVSVTSDVGANVATYKADPTRTFKIPGTSFGIEVGAGATGSVGVAGGTEDRVGYFKDTDGKRRLGLKLGGKGALGLGLNLRGSVNLVW